MIWYTANDLLSRVAGQPGGTGAETQANTMMLEVRAFLNEGGRLLYTGRHAGWQFANAFDYNPVSTPPLCDAVDLEANDGCLFLSDDFLQYWLGAYLFVEDGGTDRGDPATTDDDTAFPVAGTDAPVRRSATTEPVDDQPDLRGGARCDHAVLHHDEQHPEDRRTTRSSRARRPRSGSPGSRGRTSRSARPTTCTRNGPTSGTSGS